MTHRADRAPEEVAKVDDQVGRYAITCFVDFLRLKDFGADMRTIVVNQRLEFSLQFVAQLLNLTGLNNTLRLTSLDIEEDTSIVTAVPQTLVLLQSISHLSMAVRVFGCVFSVRYPSRMSHSLTQMPPSIFFAPWSETM